MLEKTKEVAGTFLNSTGLELSSMKKEVSLILKRNKEKVYQINYKKMLSDYIKLNHDCIDEFSMNYTFGYFMLNPKIDTPINREAYFLELKAYITNYNNRTKLVVA